jgi:hypothetical protein
MSDEMKKSGSYDAADEDKDNGIIFRNVNGNPHTPINPKNGEVLFEKSKSVFDTDNSENDKPPKEKIINAYRESVNPEIITYIDDVKNGKIKTNLRLIAVSDREAADIERLTGVNTYGFTRILTPDSVRHIVRRHGENGEADKSMKDVNDIARIEYALANYDYIDKVDKTRTQYKDADGKQAQVIKYVKRINGNYFVAEAVPDSKAKTLVIMSAYKSV